MKRILTLTVLFFAALAQAQDQYYNDAQVRFNLGLEKRITKKFSVTLDQQDRFTKNVSQFNRGSLDIGLLYKLNKHIWLKANYVYIQKRKKEDYFAQRNWYYAAVILRQDFRYFKISFRNLFQVRMGDTNSDEQYIARYYYRGKISLKYELTKRYKLWVAEELYVPLNSPQVKGFDRSRSYLGLTIKTFKNQELDLYFMLQTRLRANEWFDQKTNANKLLRRDYIYGVNYNIEF
jgi:hypothetical protein